MAKAKKKEGVEKPPLKNPASEALKSSILSAKEKREEEAVEAEIKDEEKLSSLRKSFDVVAVIKNATLPENTTEVWITEDTQVFLRADFAYSHGTKRKLKVHHVKI